MDFDRLEPMLERFVAARFGPDHRLAAGGLLEDGHAGLTYHFAVSSLTVPEPLEMVLKLAPPGVRRSGNTAVYRQARLLQALHAAKLPVPGILFASPEETAFGTPYLVMPRLPGRTFVVWTPHRDFPSDAASVASIWQRSARALAVLHGFDWRAGLAVWEEPKDLALELQRLDPLLPKAPDPGWTELGRKVRRRLAATIPQGGPVGLVHGDYQPGNILFADTRFVAVVDWELAGIGDQRLDLGWLLMMADAASWPGSFRPVAPPDSGGLVRAYEAQLGRPAGDLRWHRAFAGYRMAAISCLNVRLHRTGRRRDPIWESFADAVPTLFGRALALLDELEGAEGPRG